MNTTRQTPQRPSAIRCRRLAPAIAVCVLIATTIFGASEYVTHTSGRIDLSKHEFADPSLRKLFTASLAAADSVMPEDAVRIDSDPAGGRKSLFEVRWERSLSREGRRSVQDDILHTIVVGASYPQRKWPTDRVEEVIIQVDSKQPKGWAIATSLRRTVEPDNGWYFEIALTPDQRHRLEPFALHHPYFDLQFVFHNHVYGSYASAAPRDSHELVVALFESPESMAAVFNWYFDSLAAAVRAKFENNELVKGPFHREGASATAIKLQYELDDDPFEDVPPLTQAEKNRVLAECLARIEKYRSVVDEDKDRLYDLMQGAFPYGKVVQTVD
ncbi:hypothetical protein [Stratiformator vulcanicus]|uniref:Uncharacterized protein n=1 Tax=Stratiformator vulcanicus TaxID=2527980 RepID=A0A517R4F7_9PLAN|nr:hypothetical protein [Stratiformator vulcanicus]QDT38751.1 hypothetical protein Pan189_31490 [Stratiformator vulcanicus]